MDDELDEQDAGDHEEPLWETSGDADALEFALSDDEGGRHRRSRLLVGGALLVIGLVVAGLAVRSATDDDKGSSEAASKRTTTTEATVVTTSVDGSTASGGGPIPDAASTGAEGAAETRWPTALGGRPPALGKQGEPPPADVGDLEPGFYLWSDFDGWHAWLVGGSDADRLTITSDAEIAKADAVGGDVPVDRLPNTFGFSRGGASEAVVGVDFNPGYLAKTFVVTVDGDTKLHIGPRRWTAPRYFGVQKNASNT